MESDDHAGENGFSCHVLIVIFIVQIEGDFRGTRRQLCGVSTVNKMGLRKIGPDSLCFISLSISYLSPQIR